MLLRLNRKPVRPHDLPIHTNPVSMDFEKRRIVTTTVGAASLSDLNMARLFWMQGDIDGGDIGDIADALVSASIRDADDGLTRALDYMYPSLEGGVL